MATMSYDQVDASVREVVTKYLLDGTSDRVAWVVFDIDETLLTCRNLGARDKRDIFRLQHKGTLPGIPTMVGLHNWLVSKGIKVALITGRGEHLKATTLYNLRTAGITGSHRLYMRPRRRGIDTTTYKVEARRDVCGTRGIILANIGDQPTDLEGGYAEHTYLLPSTY